MANIGNTDRYPLVTNASLLDYLIGTRKSDGATVNFSIQEIVANATASQPLTRAEVLQLISDNDLTVNASYTITDAVGGTFVVIAQALTNNSLLEIVATPNDVTNLYKYNITADTIEVFAGSVEEAPNDGKNYVRANEAWADGDAIFSKIAELSQINALTFDKPRAHGTSISPLTGDLVLNIDNAVPQTTATIWHQQETAPNIDAGDATISKTVGQYTATTPATLNFIIISYISSSDVVVTYVNDVDLSGKADKYVSIRTQPADVDTLLVADDGGLVRYTAATATAVTVPQNSSVAFPVGTVITMRQAAAGVITLSGEGGTVLNGNVSTNGQNSSIQIMKVDTDVWDVIGGAA